MTKNKSTIPSSSFPSSFLDIFVHVLNTGESITIGSDKLGKEYGKYSSLRHRMHQWRIAMKAENKTIAEELYQVKVVVPPKVMRKEDQEYWIRIEPKSAADDEVLSGLAPRVNHLEYNQTKEPKTPTKPVKKFSEITSEPELPHDAGGYAMKTLDEIFNMKEDDE